MTERDRVIRSCRIVWIGRRRVRVNPRSRIRWRLKKRFERRGDDTLLRNHRDGPTLERAGPIFLHGTNHPRDGRSHERQRCFLAPVLGITGASRLDRIGRFDCLHAVTMVAVRETFPRRDHRISETLNKDSRWSQNTGTSTASRSGAVPAVQITIPRNVSFSQFVPNYSRMVFGEPRNEPFLKHRRALGVSVPHHPIEPGIASHKKARQVRFFTHSAFASLVSSCRARACTDFKGRLRFAEIKTQDFPPLRNSSKRRSSSGVQLLCRRAAPVTVLCLTRSKVMAYCLRSVAQTFCRTGQFPILAAVNPALKSDSAVLPEGTVSRTYPARMPARYSPLGGFSLPLHNVERPNAG